MDVNHKVCVITGANSGIGKATAVKLAAMGAYIVMICRNEEKAQAAKNDIIEKSGNTGVDILIADLAHLYDVRRAAGHIGDRYQKVDLLINNAGIYPSGREETPEGIERTFAINYLSHFLLTNLLMEQLKASDGARVINVSSDMHKTASVFFDLDNLMLERGYLPFKAYALSKICNVMFTHELARRTPDTSILSFALHPGVVHTSLPSEAGWLLNLAYLVGRPFMKSPMQGAETPVHLAVSENVQQHNGQYFKNKKPASPASLAVEDQVTEKLWKRSEVLAGLGN